MKTTLFSIAMTAIIAIAMAGCGKDNDSAGGGAGEELWSTWMEVAPARLAASTAAGSYTFGVACGAAWTAVADLDAALWCKLAGNSATGNGTVTVSVEENKDAAPRTATITVTAGKTSLTVAVVQEAAVTPPPATPVAPPARAASAQTWTFSANAGALVWSDVIQIEACNKHGFTSSTVTPQCRSFSHTASGKTYYYYNWPYVNANKATLCPAPWRVPDQHDLYALKAALIDGSPLTTAWGGNGGRAIDANTVEDWSGRVWLWASSPATDHPGHAWSLYYEPQYHNVPYDALHYGYQVRCVR